MQHTNKLNEYKNNCIFFCLNNKNTDNNKECSISQQKKSIHKIAKIDLFVNNELTNVNKIRNITNYKLHYYVCNNSTELKISHINDNTIIGNDITTDNHILLQFDNIELNCLKSYLNNIGSATKHIYALIYVYKIILKSISLLVSQQIVHNNINFETIVVDKHNNPLLTNFTFSIDTTNKNFKHYVNCFLIAYEPSYLEWPIEFHIITYLLTNKLSSLSIYNIEIIINNVIEQHTILKKFGDSIVSLYKEESILYFNKYVNQTYEYILTDILKYCHTWDNYALSILYLRILININKTIGIKNKFVLLFMRLLVDNIHFNPTKRLHVDVTIDRFNIMLDNLNTRDYKEVIDKLTSSFA